MWNGSIRRSYFQSEIFTICPLGCRSIEVEGVKNWRKGQKRIGMSVLKGISSSPVKAGMVLRLSILEQEVLLNFETVQPVITKVNKRKW